MKRLIICLALLPMGCMEICNWPGKHGECIEFGTEIKDTIDHVDSVLDVYAEKLEQFLQDITHKIHRTNQPST